MKALKEINRWIRAVTLGAGMVFSATIFTGCVSDDSPCIEDRPDYDPNSNVWISFKIYNQGAMSRISGSEKSSDITRSLEDNQGHKPEAATAEENYIDENDLTVIILDGNRNAIKTLSGSDLILTSIEKSNSYYELKTNINRQYFDLIGEGSPFYLLVVANNYGTTFGGEVYRGLWMQNLEELGRSHKAYNYSPSENYVWIPNGSNQRIPMAGLQRYNFTKADLDAAKDGANPLKLADLTMQRSMAKIRILDIMQTQNATIEYPKRISKVEFRGGYNKGAYLPDFRNSSIGYNTLWSEQTDVIDYASGLTAWRDENSIVLTQGSGYNENDNFTDANNNKITYQGKFECYVPEQLVTNNNSNPGASKPLIRIYTQDFIGNSWIDSNTYDFNLENIIVTTGATPSAKQKDIVRNHIYQFVVKASEKAVIDIYYTVCPWGEVTSGNIDFN